MNLIVICLDTFRQDHVSFYNQGKPVFEGVPACKTPNIDAFAKECIVFDNMYPCGLPTIPIRTELMTGQFVLPFRSWEPLHSTDVTAAQLLQKEGYVCGLIADNYHYRAPNMNFHRGFNEYRWIRGQEYDAHNSAPTRRNIDDYVNANYPESWRKRIAQFLANTDEFQKDSDWFGAQVVQQACDWLTKNRAHKKLFCWIDSFDPHEPWDPPKRFDTYTDPKYKGKRLIMPMGGMASSWATPEEIRHIQGLYAGEAAFVDHCLGALFDCLKTKGYFDDSIIVLTADHGHPLGDHGKLLKGADRMYSELLKVPFMIHLPEKLKIAAAGRRTQAIGQFADVLPTLLDLMGMANNTGAMQGESMRAVIEGSRESHRDAIIAGFHPAADRVIRDDTWSYIERPAGESDELYNIKDDPRERRNVIDEHKDVAARLKRRFGNVWRARPAPDVKGLQGKYEVSSGVE